jgi:pyruvate formate lyase activating enzyme
MASKSNMPVLRLSGIQPFTQLDYPGLLACVAFLPGCNFRCGYCHNPEFVLPDLLLKTQASWVGEADFFSFLGRRRDKLDAVVISGGEPTLQRGLMSFMRRVKDMGFKVKLDTNGSRPDILKSLLDDGCVDYIAMDVKTSLERYAELVGPCLKPEAIRESMLMVMDRAPEYEFRTTLLREVHSLSDVQRMAELAYGARRYALQRFRPATTLDPVFGRYSAPDDAEMNVIADVFRSKVKELILR